ncbi:hypothetical protein [Streptomyces sp. NPDC006012]|uniref:hypothetical protein n=1 Tax=Streptomyces sp. NPDC006012 TaxID=3364739 RepID=UPI00368C12A3
MTYPRSILLGAAAGAAGTTALDIVGYADMAYRGRAASDTPEITVRKFAARWHIRIPGEGEALANRVSGLAPLTGYAAGLGMGALLGFAGAAGWNPPTPCKYLAATVGALVGTNGPMTVLGVTDPRTWGMAGWISDIVPHLAYALVTVSVLDRLLPSS